MKFKYEAIARDSACVRCKTEKSLTVHHVAHRSLGGDNSPENLQTVCKQCHNYLHCTLRLPSGVPYSEEIEKELRAKNRAEFERKRREAPKVTPAWVKQMQQAEEKTALVRKYSRTTR